MNYIHHYYFAGGTLPGCNLTDTQYALAHEALLAYAASNDIAVNVDINKADLEVACLLCKLTYVVNQGNSYLSR